MRAELAQTNIKIRPSQESDTAAVQQLVSLCYGDAAEPPEWWRWRHFRLETSRSEIYLIAEGDQIIGMQPMAFFRHTLCGKPINGAVLTGVMVHPDHRRKGIFRNLIKACVEAAWRDGIEFVTTMPNDLSYPGFMKLGWLDPGARTLLVRPLDLVAVAQNKVRPSWLGSVTAVLPQIVVQVTSPGSFSSNLAVLSVDRFDAVAADDLAKRLAAASKGLALWRDGLWLNWRYVANPLINYKRFEARLDGKSLCGVAVTTMETRKDVRVGYIVELVGETSETRRALISTAVQQLKKDGAQIVLTVFSEPASITDLCQQGFYRVPKYLSPKTFYTVYKPHPDKLELLAPLKKIENWQQTLGDWDGI